MAAIYIIGSMPGGRNTLCLGKYVRREGLRHNGRDVYISESCVLWFTDGSWYVGSSDSWGGRAGFMTVADEASSPEDIVSTWEVAPGWIKAPDVSVVAAEQHEAGMAAARAGAALAVCLTGETPGNANSACFGRYTMLPDMLHNERHVYKMQSGSANGKTALAQNMLWWTGGSWYIGPSTAWGGRSGFLCCQDDAMLPERIATAWQLPQNGGWADAPNLKCVAASEVDAASAEERSGGVPRVYLTGRYPEGAGGGASCNGPYEREEAEGGDGRLHHDRFTYVSRDDGGDRRLWWAGGSWWVGSNGKGWGGTAGFLTARSNAFVPEAVEAGAWRVIIDGEWAAAPRLICTAECPKPTDVHSDGRFVDDEFPPELSSALVPQALVKRESREVAIAANSSGVVDCWLRVADLMDGRGIGKAVLYDRVDPGDILQGRLGNCWLLAGFACVAEFPTLIRALFDESELSTTGQYHVRLYDIDAGQWTRVVIDDLIPCEWRYGAAVESFTHPSGSEAWVLLLEKAVAKWAGGYAALAGGFTAYAFVLLLGPRRDVRIFDFNRDGHADGWACGTFDLDKVRATGGRNAHQNGSFSFDRARPSLSGRELFSELTAADLNDNVIAAAIDSERGGEHERSDGLVEGHAFSVLQVLEVHATRRGGAGGEETLRLVQLRNPWGSAKEWNGRWSDGSDLWKQYPEVGPQQRQEVARKAMDDAIAQHALGGGGGGAANVSSREDPSVAWLEHAFHRFDIDGNGSLSPQEVLQILTREGTGAALSVEDAKELIADFDEDGDGQLSLSEFVRAFAPQRGVAQEKGRSQRGVAFEIAF